MLLSLLMESCLGASWLMEPPLDWANAAMERLKKHTAAKVLQSFFIELSSIDLAA
jgi:hypothetical protein